MFERDFECSDGKKKTKIGTWCVTSGVQGASTYAHMLQFTEMWENTVCKKCWIVRIILRTPPKCLLAVSFSSLPLPQGMQLGPTRENPQAIRPSIHPSALIKFFLPLSFHSLVEISFSHLLISLSLSLSLGSNKAQQQQHQSQREGGGEGQFNQDFGLVKLGGEGCSSLPHLFTTRSVEV